MNFKQGDRVVNLATGEVGTVWFVRPPNQPYHGGYVHVDVGGLTGLWDAIASIDDADAIRRRIGAIKTECAKRMAVADVLAGLLPKIKRT